MSFAYVQGREAEALAFFEDKLSAATDPSERKQLEEIVSKLRELVGKDKQGSYGALTFQNTSVCFS
jgi:hypothetical protein